MGTRHLIMVVKDKKYKIAQYGQWDGNPGATGMDILNFLKIGDVNALRKNVSLCSFISDERLDKKLKGNEDWPNEFPEWSRDTGSKILGMVAKQPMILCDRLDFVKDSLFCEWAYVIDFDAGMFEVYQGFNKEMLVKGKDRFWHGGYNHKEYYPVRLIIAFKLNELPDDNKFVEICNRAGRSDEVNALLDNPNDDNDFIFYLSDKAQDIIKDCSAEELAEFAFGDLEDAVESYLEHKKKEK